MICLIELLYFSIVHQFVENECFIPLYCNSSTDTAQSMQKNKIKYQLLYQPFSYMEFGGVLIFKIIHKLQLIFKQKMSNSEDQSFVRPAPIRYSRISYSTKQKLIKMVEEDKKKVSSAAKMLKLKPSTAKMIMGKRNKQKKLQSSQYRDSTQNQKPLEIVTLDLNNSQNGQNQFQTYWLVFFVSSPFQCFEY